MHVRAISILFPMSYKQDPNQILVLKCLALERYECSAHQALTKKSSKFNEVIKILAILYILPSVVFPYVFKTGPCPKLTNGRSEPLAGRFAPRERRLSDVAPPPPTKYFHGFLWALRSQQKCTMDKALIHFGVLRVRSSDAWLAGDV